MVVAALIAGALGGYEASASFFLYPAIRDTIGNGDAAAASWVLTIAGIVGAAILLQAGRLADRFGHPRLFVVGMSGFVVASVIAALAPTLALVVVGRGLQAAAQAVMGPSGLAIIVGSAAPEQRNRAMGQWASFVGAAGVLGPVVTTRMIDLTSWRGAMLLMLPLALAAVWMARSGWSYRHAKPAAPPPLDIVGAIAVMAGLAVLVLALLKGNAWGWGSARSLGLFGAAVALLGAALLRARHHPDPALPTDLFRFRTINFASALGLIAAISFFGHWLALLGYLTSVWGYSATTAALWLTIPPGTMTVLARWAGRMIDRRGFHGVMVPAAVVYAAGFATFGLFAGPEPNRALLVVALLGAGVGMAGIWPSLVTCGTQGIPNSRLATAAALLQTMQRIGGSLGSALAVVLVSGNGDLLDVFKRPIWMLVIGGMLMVPIALTFRRRAPALAPRLLAD